MKTLVATVTCKHCGRTVMFEKTGVSDTSSSSGTSYTKSCSNCHKTSSYHYNISKGQFVDLR